MIFEPLRAEHVVGLDGLQDVGGFVSQVVTPELAVDLEECGGWAAVDGDPIAIGGIFKLRPGCGHAWTWLTRRWRRHARVITERVALELELTDMHRVEAAVRCDYAAGHRWATRLGFELEAPVMRKWGPDGADYALYARVR